MTKFHIPLFVNSLSSFLSEHPIYSNLISTAITSGGEQLLENIVLECPNDRYLAKIMGWIFLFCPPVLLFLLTMALNTRFWYVYQGCCLKSRKSVESSERDQPPHAPVPDANTSEHPNKRDPLGKQQTHNPCIFDTDAAEHIKIDQLDRSPSHAPIPDDIIAEYSKRNQLDEMSPNASGPEAAAEKTHLDPLDTPKCSTFLLIAFRALLAPCIWVVTALFDGDYLVCCLAGKSEETDEILRIKAISRLTAWGVLIVIAVVGTTVTCCIHCWDRNTFLQSTYEETYREKLEDEAKKEATKKATEDAGTLVKTIGTAVEPGRGKKETINRNVRKDSENVRRDKGKKDPKLGCLNCCEILNLENSQVTPLCGQEPVGYQSVNQMVGSGPSGLSTQQRDDGAPNDIGDSPV